MGGSALTWPEVAARLQAAGNYWLCTTTRSGAPHAAPVWGVVVGQTLSLYSERSTVKARNIAADPRVLVQLEGAEDVLAVRGTAEDVGAPAQLPEVVPAGRAVTGGLARVRKPAQVNAVFYWKSGGSGGGPPARAAPEEGTPAAAGAADQAGTGQSPADDRNHRPGWLVP